VSNSRIGDDHIEEVLYNKLTVKYPRLVNKLEINEYQYESKAKYADYKLTIFENRNFKYFLEKMDLKTIEIMIEPIIGDFEENVYNVTIVEIQKN